MNILVTINDRYVKFLMVMLVSLFKNNRNEKIKIFCLYNELCADSQKELTRFAYMYDSDIIFIYVDSKIYSEFPTTRMLTVECYFPLLAHELLPSDINRILYLDCDLIIDGNLFEFYNQRFENNYMVVCGQNYKIVDGKWYAPGSSPQKGSCFNSGVLLMNLDKFREDITADTYLLAAKEANYQFDLADQGILNVLFYNKVKYENTMIYNFRLGIYEEYLTSGEVEEIKIDGQPIIYHYTNHDNYKIGVIKKPWNFTLSEQEYKDLQDAGLVDHLDYEKLYEDTCFNMMNLWWKYAKELDIYDQMKEVMEERKSKILEKLYQSRK